MFLQEAPTQSTLGFVPLALTIVMHMYLRRNVITPLENLSLEIAAHVDVDDGEFDADTERDSLYAQPCLKDAFAEDRQPLPYRRDQVAVEGGDAADAVVEKEAAAAAAEDQAPTVEEATPADGVADEMAKEKVATEEPAIEEGTHHFM